MARQDKFSLGSDRRRLINLGLLYVSKSGSVLVGLLILPLFNRELGSDQFGVVALILSLQALFLLLDFGMATIVGRNLALAESTASQRYTTWRVAEWTISLLYVALTPFTLLVVWLWNGPLTPTDVLCCIVLFWALTLQNIGQNALLARHRFAETAVIQVVGLLVRQGLTAIFLVLIEASLTCFVLSQAAVAIVQMLVTRWRCILELRPNTPQHVRIALWSQAKNLLRNGRSLMVFGLAGAAGMQLDKAIVSGVMSPGEVGPYFLTTTFCLTPISVLAAPVAQFFQSRLVRTLNTSDLVATHRTLTRFIHGITVCSLLPSGLIWLLREPLIAAWLHNTADAGLVALYSAILLPGVAIGALGYVPYTMLVAHQDYAFQARFSLMLTLVTLIAALLAALQSSLLAVCAVYAFFHGFSTIGSWWRCIRLNIGGDGNAAAGARQAAITVLLVFGGTGCVAAFATQFKLVR